MGTHLTPSACTVFASDVEVTLSDTVAGEVVQIELDEGNVTLESSASLTFAACVVCSTLFDIWGVVTCLVPLVAVLIWDV